MKNTAYIFIPFLFDDPNHFRPLVQALDQSAHWEPKADKAGYLLKYVAGKFDRQNPDLCHCFHYSLHDQARERFGLFRDDTVFSTSQHHCFGSDRTRFSFRILSVHLFCFSTTLCIFAFQLSMESSDPFQISAAEYYLKKVGKEIISPLDAPDQATTLLKLSSRLAEEIPYVSPDSFFFFSVPGSERANLLTIVDVPAQEQYGRELFYLRNCYHDGYLFREDASEQTAPSFAPSQDVIWGVSSEAAVCLTCAERGRADFLQNVFYPNFNRHYLLMYIMLLHQKYVLYLFLTRVNVGACETLEALEEYRRLLYEFETDFVFTRVTEVPQYEKLYERIFEAFSLESMYKDVHEPLLLLSEVRRTAEQKAQEKQDRSLSTSLLFLSLLSIFSALIDSISFVRDFIGKLFGQYLGEVLIVGLQWLCVIAITVVAVLVIKNLNRRKKQ